MHNSQLLRLTTKNCMRCSNHRTSKYHNILRCINSNFTALCTAPVRKTAFASIYNFAHPDLKATVRMVSEKLVWPNVKKESAIMAKTCSTCRRVKVFRHVSVPLDKFKTPNAYFQHVHIDLLGHLPVSRGYSYDDQWLSLLRTSPKKNSPALSTAGGSHALVVPQKLRQIEYAKYARNWLASPELPIFVQLPNTQLLTASLNVSIGNLSVPSNVTEQKMG